MNEPRWSHEGVSLTVVPPRGKTFAAGVPVLVSVGMIGVGVAGSLTAMVFPEVATELSMLLSSALVLGGPAPLVLSARWTNPTSVDATYTGLSIGARHYPRARILGAEHRGGRVHVLLDDGSIVRTPPVEASVGEAIQAAFRKPADLFERSRSEQQLAGVRGGLERRAGAPAGSPAAPDGIQV